MIHLTGVGAQVRGDVMATRTIGAQAGESTPRWYSAGYPGSPTCNRGYLLATVRTGLIALVLLVLLVTIATI